MKKTLSHKRTYIIIWLAIFPCSSQAAVIYEDGDKYVETGGRI